MTNTVKSFTRFLNKEARKIKSKPIRRVFLKDTGHICCKPGAVWGAYKLDEDGWWRLNPES